MIERIFLTGGSGFVGSYLYPALRSAFPAAKIMRLRQPPRSNSCEVALTLESVADIADADSIDGIIRDFRPDVVFHLAGQASAHQAATEPYETWRVNAVGTLVLAGSLAKYSPSAHFINVSSAEVYGESFRNGPACEKTPLRPINVYARSKAAAEAIAADILPPTTRLVTVRPFNHSGPGQDGRFVLPAFANQIVRIEQGLQPPIIEVGNLDACREFLDVRDVTAAYVSLLKVLPSLDKREVFNVASSKAYKIGDLLNMMRKLTSVQFETATDPSRLRPSEIPVVIGTTKKMMAYTGWSAERTVEQLISDILIDARVRLEISRPNPR